MTPAEPPPEPDPESAPDGAGVTAVLLAGGGDRDPLARAAGVAAKALIPVEGRTMAERIGAALAASQVVTRVVCVGSRPVQEAVSAGVAAQSRTEGRSEGERAALVGVPAGDGFAASLALGFGAALAFAPARLLVVTADIPWLRPDDVTRFVRDAAALRTPAGEAPALVYPAVPRVAAEAAFPGQRRTWVRLIPPGASTPQEFTGGNVVMVDPAAAPRLLALAERAYRARKNPLALARLLGPATLVGLLTGRLRMAGLERRASAYLGVPVRTLLTALPTLAADLDRPDQLASAAPPASRSAPLPPTSEEIP